MDQLSGNSTKPIRRSGERSQKSRKNNSRVRIEELERELSKYKDLYVRQLAEMDNYAKNKEKEIASIYRNSSREVVKSLLPFMDSLDAALKHDGGNSGLITLKNQIVKILSAYGFSEIQAIGKSFNPYLHEAIGIVESNDDNIIVEEIQKGYMLNDEVIRTSKVIVGRRK